MAPKGAGPESSDPRGGDEERDFRKQCLETSLKENSAKKAHMRGRRKPGHRLQAISSPEVSIKSAYQ